MSGRPPWPVRLYAALTALLPPDLGATDRDDMVDIYAALRAEAVGPLDSFRVTARSLGA